VTPTPTPTAAQQYPSATGERASVPGDVQLTALQSEPAPLDYVVPQSAVVRVKSVHALFTDNGAGGDWLPAVQLISDSGHTIAIASDQGAKVTAGGDAHGSFFPGAAKGAASSTPTGAGVAVAEMWFSQPQFADPMVSVPAG